MGISTINVLGAPLAEVNLDTATEFLLNAASAGRKGYVCVVSVHGVVESQFNTKFLDALNNSLLNTPDGMPLVWFGRISGYSKISRVYGPDLMLRMMQATRDGRFSHFFFGGAPGVAEQLKKEFEQRYSGVKIVGTFTPPFRPLNEIELAALKTTLNEVRPHFFWVGLGTPKQEIFMMEHSEHLNAGIMLGVGAAFDFHSGRIQQAPRWIRHNGFEWLFRLIKEPRRLWMRYAVIVPVFLWHVFLSATRIRSYPLSRKRPFEL